MNEKHVTELELELFLLSPDNLSEDVRSETAGHLATCSFCTEHLNDLREFYQNFVEESKKPPSVQDYELADAILGPSDMFVLPPHLQTSLAETYVKMLQPTRASLPARIVEYARLHPRYIIGGAFAILAALVFVIATVRPTKDINPAFAKIENGVLKAYSHTGKLLWSKPAEDMPNVSSDSAALGDLGLYHLLTIADLYGDGQKEILLFGYCPAGKDLSGRRRFSEDTLYCLNYDGTIAWKYTPVESIQFGKHEFTQHALWQIRDILLYSDPGQMNGRIIVASYTRDFFPAKLSEVDARTGNELQQFWNPGGISFMNVFDADGDGRQELVIGGTNNSFNASYLCVFDPNHITGCAPTTPDFVLNGIEIGREKYYVLLPPSPLQTAFGAVDYNHLQGFTRQQAGYFEIRAYEDVRVRSVLQDSFVGGIGYIFGPGMRVSSIFPDDGYLKVHRILKEQNAIHFDVDSTFLKRMQESVLYWDGKEFVHEVAINQSYRELSHIP